MPSKFGGIPVESGESKFGGVPVDDAQGTVTTQTTQKPITQPSIQPTQPPTMEEVFGKYSRGELSPDAHAAATEMLTRHMAGTSTPGFSGGERQIVDDSPMGPMTERQQAGRDLFAAETQPAPVPEPAQQPTMEDMFNTYIGGGFNQEQSGAFEELARRQFARPQEPERSIAEFATETVGNVPESAMTFFDNIKQAVMHPIDTAKAIAEIGGGALEAAQLVEPESSMPGDREAFEELTNMISERYGSTDAAADTLRTDPVGFAADFSALLSGAGALVAKLPGSAGKVGSAVRAAGEVVNPVNIAKQAIAAPITAAAKVIPSKVPEKLYGSATKMSTTLDPADRTARIRTALDEGIMPSQAGLDKIDTMMKSTNKEITDLIKRAGKEGDTVSSSEIMKRLDDLKKFADETIDPESIHSAISEIESGFIKAHGDNVPVSKAQNIKKNTYKILKKAYGELKSSNIEAQKQVARGIREELSAKYPILDDLNLRESSLIKLNQSLEKAVARITNRDILGVGHGLKTGTGAVVGGTPGAAAGFVLAVLDQPKVKAAIAIALSKARKINIKRASIKPVIAEQVGKIGTENSE